MPKVLIADDSMAVRKVAERHLTLAGLEVTLAGSGEEAIALLGQEQPDLIVCDVIMPDKSGYEVCAYARSQPALAKTPFLLITGILNAEVTGQAETCGADGILKKPFQGTTLQDRVLELLGAKAEALAPSQPAQPAFETSRMEPALTETPVEEVPPPEPRLRFTEPRRSTPLEEEETSKPRAKQLEDLAEHLLQARQAGEWVKELETALQAERQKLSQLKRRMAELEQTANRVAELQALLVKERERSAQLSKRLTAVERGASRVEEAENLLAMQCKRTAQLHQQLADAEERARLAMEREKELARRLAQIANLSQ